MNIKVKKTPNKLNQDSPLISIVTIALNAEKNIQRTIDSVFNQTYKNIEYILIDGESTDGTLSAVEKNIDKIDIFLSEKDSGIYDAMNKGIDLASGDWINFMNAGDTFSNINVIEEISFIDLASSPIIYGNKIYEDVVQIPHPCKSLKFGEIMACHQAMFFNMSPNFKDSIFYDLKYKIYADYELVNRLYIKFGNFKYVNKNIAIYQGGGISAVTSYQKRKDKYGILYNSYGLIGIFKGLLFRIFKTKII